VNRTLPAIVLVAFSGTTVISAQTRNQPASQPVVDQTRHNREGLLQASMQAPATERRSQGLLRAAENLDRIQLFANHEEPPTLEPATKPAAEDKTVHQPRPLSASVLAKLKVASIGEPTQELFLANALFQSGQLDAAYKVYGHALNKAEDPERKAWLILQQAACLRDRDPEKAIQLYEEVCTAYAESPWAGVAKTEKDVLSFQQEQDPQALLDRIEEQMKRFNRQVSGPSDDLERGDLDEPEAPPAPEDRQENNNATRGNE